MPVRLKSRDGEFLDGEFLRFAYLDEKSSSDINLTWDHYVMMLPEEYRTRDYSDNKDYHPCLLVREFFVVSIGKQC